MWDICSRIMDAGTFFFFFNWSWDFYLISTWARYYKNKQRISCCRSAGGIGLPACNDKQERVSNVKLGEVISGRERIVTLLLCSFQQNMFSKWAAAASPASGFLALQFFPHKGAQKLRPQWIVTSSPSCLCFVWAKGDSWGTLEWLIHWKSVKYLLLQL